MHSGKRGQISILMVFSLIPLFTLFAFVVNVGMLVNAKIMLQNAADLAAYSGAAAQARQLTHISHLNYAMRQAYKKFLFRYYVLGNISLRNFPGNTGAPAPSAAEFNFVNPATAAVPGQTCLPNFPGAPVVCLALDVTSNPCQLGCAIPKVAIPTCANFLDPICQTLADAAQQIQVIQSFSCNNNSLANAELTIQWLFGTGSTSIAGAPSWLPGLLSDTGNGAQHGVGLVMEEALLWERIQTIASYLNAKPQVALNPQTIKAVQQFPDQARAERTLMAYYTAVNNLNDHVFGDTMEMTELMPGTMFGVSAVQAQNASTQGFSIPWIHMDSGTGVPDPTNSAHPQECQMYMVLQNANPYLGVNVLPTSHVFYAVKLTAKAQLLFNPFPFNSPNPDGITLTAYAAAQPFGSRIGPKLNPADFLALATNPAPIGGGASTFYYPKLDFATGIDMGQQQVLSAFAKILKGQAANGGGLPVASISSASLQQALAAALLPDEYEIGKYNVPVDSEILDTEGKPPVLSSDKGMVSYYRASPNGTYTFWAPLSQDGNQTKLNSDLTLVIKSQLSNSQTTSGANLPEQAQITESETLLNHLQSFIASAKQHVATIPDPLSQQAFAANGGQPPQYIPGKITASAANKSKLATSWTTPNDPDYYKRGRVGYSVKLIPFRMLLTAPGYLTNTGAASTWAPVTESLSGERTELLNLVH